MQPADGRSNNASASQARPLPDAATLTSALEAVFGRRTHVIERRGHPAASSFPGEIVRCSVDEDREACVLCKYGAGELAPSFGHRGGPRYEAAVYRSVLASAPLTAPRFFGAWEDPGGETWLFVEYLDGARPASKKNPEEMLPAAARWAARFHAVGAEPSSVLDRRGLKVYDAAYFLRWARRATRLAGEQHDVPWLAAVCDRAEPLLSALPDGDVTIIHGEFTPNNVLARDGVILPVDWETAAIAIGEIDLAGLTENWPPDLVRVCEREYVRVRWPDGEPDQFSRNLDLARLYWTLRWLGDRRSRRRQPKRVFDRYAALGAIAERLGLL
jgi:hypothetical protein